MLRIAVLFGMVVFASSSFADITGDFDDIVLAKQGLPRAPAVDIKTADQFVPGADNFIAIVNIAYPTRTMLSGKHDWQALFNSNATLLRDTTSEGYVSLVATLAQRTCHEESEPTLLLVDGGVGETENGSQAFSVFYDISMTAHRLDDLIKSLHHSCKYIVSIASKAPANNARLKNIPNNVLTIWAAGNQDDYHDKDRLDLFVEVVIGILGKKFTSKADLLNTITHGYEKRFSARDGLSKRPTPLIEGDWSSISIPKIEERSQLMRNLVAKFGFGSLINTNVKSITR